MKNLKIFWLILSLTVLMLPSLESKPSGFASSLLDLKKDPCEEQQKVVDGLIKKIKDQNTPAAGEDKSPLEKAEDEIEQRQSWLNEYRCSNKHSPDVKDERRDKENRLDKLREEYAKMLALTEQLQEEIEKFKTTCQTALENDESNESLDLKEYELFHKEQEETYQEKREDLVKAAVDEEFVRALEKKHHKKTDEDCPKYYLRLLKEIERQVGEKERAYRKRLIDFQRHYPWKNPTAEMPEDDAKERNRRIEEKWSKGFWEKVRDAIKAKIKDLEDNAHIVPEPPQEENEQPKEEDENPDDENALPWEDRKEKQRTIDYRGTFFGGWLVNPGTATFEMEQMEGLLKSIYEQPDIYQELTESLGSEEFTLGTYSTAPVFTETITRPGKQGGVMLTYEFLAQCEMGIQFTYSNTLAEAHFPVTSLDFGSTDPTPVTIQGDYTLLQKTMGLRTGGNYRFGNGSWQPLLGVWGGIVQQHETVRASIADVNWELGEATSTAFSYSLEAALRWQSPGKLFLNLQGQWSQTGGNGNYGAALGLGLHFGR